MSDPTPSEVAARFSEHVFGQLPPAIDRDYSLRDGFHVLSCEPPDAFERFSLEAPATMTEFLTHLDCLLGDMIDSVSRRRSNVLAAVKEGLWVFACEQEVLFDCRTSRTHRAHVVASPSYAFIKNLDTAPLKFKRFRFGASFEAAEAKLEAAESGRLAPGDSLVLNGFREALAWADDGVLLGVISTFPRGAYDAIFALDGGRRLGLLSSDLRTASLGLALRMFAAAGYQGAERLSDRGRRSPLRELRWAALNFDWQSNASELESKLSAFRCDPDTEIAQLAEFCFDELKREQATARRAGAST